jgi:hypothetical protein
VVSENNGDPTQCSEKDAESIQDRRSKSPLYLEPLGFSSPSKALDLSEVRIVWGHMIPLISSDVIAPTVVTIWSKSLSVSVDAPGSTRCRAAQGGCGTSPTFWGRRRRVDC